MPRQGRQRIVEPMELDHLPYRDVTFEYYVGLRGLQANGLTQWRRHVENVVGRLTIRTRSPAAFACGKQRTRGHAARKG